MKKLILSIILSMFVVNSSFAGFTDGEWFDPTLGCVAAGGLAYSMSTQNQAIIGGASCAITALAIYLIQERARSSQKNEYMEEISDLKKSLKEYEILQAQKAAAGEDDSVSIKVRQVVPGYKDSKGNVVAPTYKDTLILPGEGIRVGD